ncbi:hypothetical protein [Salibacterium sp. K-3]
MKRLGISGTITGSETEISVQKTLELVKCHDSDIEVEFLNLHKVIGFIAIGGLFHHYLVIANQLKPIAGYFRADVAPGYVFRHDSHFNEKRSW